MTDSPSSDRQDTTATPGPFTVRYQPGANEASIVDAEGSTVADVYLYTGEDAEGLALAYQMAAAPLMAAYIEQRDRQGDAEASAILEAINGHA